jgi:hypothetical protein
MRKDKVGDKMPHFVKSASLNKTFGPFDSLLETQAEAEKMETALRENGFVSDVHVITVGPRHATAAAERGKQSSKRIPSSVGGKTSKKKPRGRKHG